MRRPARKPANLSQSLNRNLTAYSLAASAAGVGMLALIQPADAKVVYTKVDKRIPGGPNSGYHLSLNNTRIVDFNIYWDFNGNPWMEIYPSKVEPSNMVIGGALYSNTYHRKWGSGGAYALGSGIPVDRSAKFQPNHTFMFVWEISCSNGDGCLVGSWYKAENKYLGLMFHIKGKVHYAWARISWYPNHSSCGNQVYKGGCYKVTGYAYQSVVGQSILTGQTKDDVQPEPGSLGALASGSAGRSVK